MSLLQRFHTQKPTRAPRKETKGDGKSKLNRANAERGALGFEIGDKTRERVRLVGVAAAGGAGRRHGSAFPLSLAPTLSEAEGRAAEGREQAD